MYTNTHISGSGHIVGAVPPSLPQNSPLFMPHVSGTFHFTISNGGLKMRPIPCLHLLFLNAFSPPFKGD